MLNLLTKLIFIKQCEMFECSSVQPVSVLSPLSCLCSGHTPLLSFLLCLPYLTRLFSLPSFFTPDHSYRIRQTVRPEERHE